MILGSEASLTTHVISVLVDVLLRGANSWVVEATNQEG